MVPGVATATPETWFQGHGRSWSQLLPTDVLPSPVVYCFYHGLDRDTDSRLWNKIFESGLALLEALLTLLNSREEVKCAFSSRIMVGVLN